MHRRQLGRRVKVGANPVGGEPCHGPFHEGGVGIPGDTDRFGQHGSGEGALLRACQEIRLAGHVGGGRVTQPGQAAGPDHLLVGRVAGFAQDGQCPIGLAFGQDAACPGQHPHLV